MDDERAIAALRKRREKLLFILGASQGRSRTEAEETEWRRLRLEQLAIAESLAATLRYEVNTLMSYVLDKEKI